MDTSTRHWQVDMRLKLELWNRSAMPFTEFRTSDWGLPKDGPSYFGPVLPPNATSQPVSVCRYRAYREPPGHPDEYLINKTWLHVFVGRLAFVAVFEVI